MCAYNIWLLILKYNISYLLLLLVVVMYLTNVPSLEH